jgi:hypothetical protein
VERLGTPDRPSLNVLVVGTDDWAVDQAVAALGARGHRALTCHRSGEPAFPCNALVEGRHCPLDVGFSVVVTVRARMSRQPAQSELGAVCGLHAGAALVVAGVSADNPFQPWARSVVEAGGDLVTECERAATDVASAHPFSSVGPTEVGTFGPGGPAGTGRSSVLVEGNRSTGQAGADR